MQNKNPIYKKGLQKQLWLYTVRAKNLSTTYILLDTRNAFKHTYLEYNWQKGCPVWFR